MGSTYGIPPPTKPTGFTKNTGSVGALQNLEKAQRIATTAITGTLRSAPTDLIDAHAGLLPMELALRKACHRAMLRCLTLPVTHSLHQVVRTAKRHPPEKHLGPLDQLLKIFKLRNTKFETIESAPQFLTEAPWVVTSIAKSRDDSILFESNDIADYKAFSDGSGQEDGIGAAAILYKKGFVRPVNEIQAYLGNKAKHNTYEAEAAGVLLALWLIRNTIETIGKTVSLYIDNQAIIMALSSKGHSSGQHLVRSIITAAMGMPCSVTFRWISSHSEVKGNEAADKIAKAAARGRSSRGEELPHLLRSPLPISVSATKQEFQANLNRRWLKIWTESPRKGRFSRIDPNFPFIKFRKKLFSLSRKQSSLIMQLRTGHIPLNFYLKRIGKIDSDKCSRCAEDPINLQIVETVGHFLFECQSYDEERDELIEKIGRSQLSLAKIMKNTDNIKALATFVNRTGRFKET